MAHPVVIMAYDKSEAIGKAVAALEEAGLEVVVLNTAKAKLVNFLGALAGQTDDDEEDTEKDEPTEETPPEEDPADVPPEEEEAVDEPTSEQIQTKQAVIEGEEIVLKLVEGAQAVLHPSSITIGAKTIYKLNESQFSFWPSAVSDEPIRGAIDVEVNNEKHRIMATFSEEVRNPPELHVSKELFDAL